MTPAHLITQDHHGWWVLAKEYKGVVSPKTYANRKQAQAAAARLGGEVMHPGRPFIVRLRIHDDEQE